jgi:hypothetical protein
MLNFFEQDQKTLLDQQHPLPLIIQEDVCEILTPQSPNQRTDELQPTVISSIIAKNETTAAGEPSITQQEPNATLMLDQPHLYGLTSDTHEIPKQTSVSLRNATDSFWSLFEHSPQQSDILSNALGAAGSLPEEFTTPVKMEEFKHTESGCGRLPTHQALQTKLNELTEPASPEAEDKQCDTKCTLPFTNAEHLGLNDIQSCFDTTILIGDMSENEKATQGFDIIEAHGQDGTQTGDENFDVPFHTDVAECVSKNENNPQARVRSGDHGQEVSRPDKNVAANQSPDDSVAPLTIHEMSESGSSWNLSDIEGRKLLWKLEQLEANNIEMKTEIIRMRHIHSEQDNSISGLKHEMAT